MAKQWVLVRGIMSESYHWWDFLPQLQAHFPQDEFHMADILGNGRSFQEITPLSVHKNIQGLRAQVPNNKKKILLGFSLGGMLALEWAHHHPEEVESVILINCSLNNSAAYKRITPYSLMQIFKSAFKKNITEREKVILRLTTAELSHEHINKIAQDWGARGQQYPVKPVNFLWQLLVAAQIPQRPSPTAPVLVLSSKSDKVVHPDCSRKIAQTWNLPLKEHPSAGHDLTLEDPKWVLDHILAFIQS